MFFKGPEAISPEFSSYSMSVVSSGQKEGYVMWIGRTKNNFIGSFDCSGMFCSIDKYQIE